MTDLDRERDGALVASELHRFAEVDLERQGPVGAVRAGRRHDHRADHRRDGVGKGRHHGQRQPRFE